MFHFKGYFEKLELDKDALNNSIKEAIAVQIRQAARAFLRAAIIKVPVYTGMARGSLQPLGRFLNVAIPITPDPRAKYYPDKTPEAGAALSSFTLPTGKEATGRFTFKLKIDVLHFLINEFYNNPGNLPLRNPTPWGALAAGRSAFKEYLRLNLGKKIPKLGKFVTRTRVEID